MLTIATLHVFLKSNQSVSPACCLGSKYSTCLDTLKVILAIVALASIIMHLLWTIFASAHLCG